ncbi:MAG: hypothetical protein MOGMAGMI_01743 [Candidatus Omnitrophica bacterium]|nr:hypothetical protein [Candidatus Omnitrophota bacterium]
MIRTLVLVLAAVTLSCAVSWADPFAEGTAAYAKGDLKTAGAAFERSIKEQGPTAAALYNLGNVAFKSGDKGRARLMYERALRVDPRDPDIAWNLSVLSRYLEDTVEPTPANVFLWPLRRVAGLLSGSELRSIFGGTLALWVLAALISAVVPGSSRMLARASILPLALCALTGTLIAVRWTELTAPVYVVLRPEVEARYGPSKRENKAFTLHEGAAARVVDRTEEWVYLELPGGRLGWVPKDSGETV